MKGDTQDESAIGLAIVGVLVVGMAVLLGEIAGNVQPKPPMDLHHIDVASPFFHHKVVEPGSDPGATAPSPYPN